MKNLNKKSIYITTGLLAFAAIGCLVWGIIHNGILHNGRVGAGFKPAPTSPATEIDPAAIKSGANQSWLANVQAQIAAEEYKIKPDRQGILQAPNRKQNLRAYYKRSGVELGPRNAGAGAAGSVSVDYKHWQFQWQTEYFGRTGAVKRVSEAEPIASGNRVEYQRDDICEWYTNKPQGIEQGFIIHHRPIKRRGGLPSPDRDTINIVSKGESYVCIVSQPVTGLTLKLTADNKAIEMCDENQAVVMRYDQLKVVDAGNKSLWAEMRVENNRIVLTYDDTGAQYPIYIDPLMTTPAWTAESDQASAYFGSSVSSAGDVNGDGFGDVIVGAHIYDNGEAAEGRAYVYLGSGSGLAASPAWTAESDQADARFGVSVSSAGDVNGDGYGDVIVGAYYYDNVEAREGRAYVYLGSGSGLAASPAWTAESDQADARFGISVSSAGDVNGDGYGDVIVGAYYYNNGEVEEGRAYVYLGSAGGLIATPAWIAESNQANANFGCSVSSAGDVNGDGYGDVIVGAYLYDNGEVDEGRAYVYLGSAVGLAVSPAWIAESNQASAYFGCFVSSAGDVNGDGYGDVIVGAYYYDNVEADEGRAYVYLGSASGLAALPSWTAESDQANAWFGFSVSSAGDVNGDGYGDVIVGAYSYTNGEVEEGRAYVYLGSASGLSASSAWTAESNQASAYFGSSVSSAGDVNGDGYSDVICGAYWYDNVEADEGRAYVYLGSASGLAASSAWTAESDQAGAEFGYSVGSAGDVNGDGYGDVICGAPYYDKGQSSEGRAYVYLGSGSGLAASPAWTAESDQADARFGVSVSSAGDVNGDGYGDVIVGAYYYDNVEAREGRAYVYLGSGSGLAASPAWTAESDQANAYFGLSVSSAGDVNGDGYGDVIVGAYWYANGESTEGRAYVYLGSAVGLAVSPSWTAESNQANAHFGYSVSSAGDVNGDGYGDVIVGAIGYYNGESDEGRAYVYLGSASGLTASPAWTAESNQASAYFGCSVSSAGDVNGDGYGDVIVGAHYYDNVVADEGRAYVYLGSATGLAASPVWTAESGQANAHFGIPVSSAGDVNGDGYADVIVGAVTYNNGESEEGRAYVYLGSSGGLAASPAWTSESNQASAYFGSSVSSAGDVNGDGYGDVICGAYLYDNGQTDEGRTYTYYGNDLGGLSVRPRQRTADGTSLIGPVCAASYLPSNTQARIRLWGRTSQGRTRAKLQVETALPGNGFTGTNFQTGTAYQDIGVSGLDMELLLTGLIPMHAYRWRARLLYDPTNAPYGLLHSPWFGMNLASLEGGCDFRTGPFAENTPTPTPGPTSTPTPVFIVTHTPSLSGPFFKITHALVRASRGENAKMEINLFQGSQVRIKIYDITGREITILRDEYMSAGRHEIEWNGSNAGSGMYLVYCEAGKHHARGKVVVVK